jgi:hypothetical protein
MTIGRHKFCGRPLLGTVRDWPNAIAFLTADILRSSCAMHDRKALFYAEVCVDDDRDSGLQSPPSNSTPGRWIAIIGGTLCSRRSLNMALRFGEKVAG